MKFDGCSFSSVGMDAADILIASGLRVLFGGVFFFFHQRVRVGGGDTILNKTRCEVYKYIHLSTFCNSVSFFLGFGGIYIYMTLAIARVSGQQCACVFLQNSRRIFTELALPYAQFSQIYIHAIVNDRCT